MTMGVVRIEQVAEVAELDELRAAMERIWGPAVVPPRNLLRGLALGGACLLVARRGDDVVGFAFGFLGWERGVHLHSHQVGVAAHERRSGIGAQLKLAQRDLCLRRGITEMRWTFDPMLAGNARFNLVHLGATVVDFLPHCYGDRVDAFNTGERTDRLKVRWRLDVPVGGEELPVPADLEQVVRVPVDDAAVRRGRDEVSAHLATVFGSGRRIVGWCAEGYVIEPVGSAYADSTG